MREDQLGALDSALERVVRRIGVSLIAKDVGDEMGVEIGSYAFPLLTELSGGALRPRELALRLGTSRPTLSWQLDRMEKMGLLRRARGEKDRRAIFVEVTTKGMELADRGGVQRRGELQRLLAKWPDERLATLISLLEEFDRNAPRDEDGDS